MCLCCVNLRDSLTCARLNTHTVHTHQQTPTPCSVPDPSALGQMIATNYTTQWSHFTQLQSHLSSFLSLPLCPTYFLSLYPPLVLSILKSILFILYSSPFYSFLCIKVTNFPDPTFCLLSFHSVSLNCNVTTARLKLKALIYVIFIFFVLAGSASVYLLF